MNRLRAGLFLLSALIVLGCSLSARRPTPTPAPIKPTATPPVILPFITPSPQPTAILSPTPSVARAAATPTLPPAAPWILSAPEAQGIDSVKLQQMLESIQKKQINLHSLLIVRHGVLVFEAYPYPFRVNEKQQIYSCTKSFASTLVGLAQQDGLVPNVNTPAYTLFPNLKVKDAKKRTITLKHLLSMSSGIEWIESVTAARSGLNPFSYIIDDKNPPQYFFDQPLETTPGSKFNYNSGGSHLLSVLVQNATGQNTFAYARERLFNPLEIYDVTWNTDTNGTPIGGAGLSLTSRDMARFGQFILQKGTWKGQTILNEAWIQEATRQQIQTANHLGYGYQWWRRASGEFFAAGWGGQQIWIIPQADMVVVFTGGLVNSDWSSYQELLDTYILPAAKSKTALPVNPSGSAGLAAKLAALTAQPASQTMPPLPEMAKTIEGRTYLITSNSLTDWNSFAFQFMGNEALLDLSKGPHQALVHVGLDGTYRVTDTEGWGPIALKGRWINANTFEIVEQLLNSAERTDFTLTFLGDTIQVDTQLLIEPTSEKGEGVWMK